MDRNVLRDNGQAVFDTAMASARNFAIASQTRWRIPLALAVSIFFNYLTRNNLALALPRIADEFGWSDRAVGSNGEVLLGVFFISYGLSNAVLSPLAERLGAKASTAIAIATFSILTLLFAPLGISFGALVILRLLLGLAQGVHIPMMSAIISQWFPLKERSRANTLWGLGMILEVAISPLLVIGLIERFSWRPAFAILGVASLVLALPLTIWLVQDRPQQSLPGRGDVAPLFSPVSERSNIGWSDLVANGRFWLAVVGGSLNNFCTFGILGWLPIYFNRAKGVDFEALGWPLTLVFAIGILGTVTMAVVGDWLGKRSLLAAVGCAIAGILIYIATQMQSISLLVLCFAGAVFFQSAYRAQEYAIIQRLLPSQRVGTGTGLYNGLAVFIGGVGGSFVPGSIVASTGSFDAGMVSIVAGAWLGAITMVGLHRLVKY